MSERFILERTSDVNLLSGALCINSSSLGKYCVNILSTLHRVARVLMIEMKPSLLVCLFLPELPVPCLPSGLWLRRWYQTNSPSFLFSVSRLSLCVAFWAICMRVFQVTKSGLFVSRRLFTLYTDTLRINSSSKKYVLDGRLVGLAIVTNNSGL